MSRLNTLTSSWTSGCLRPSRTIMFHTLSMGVRSIWSPCSGLAPSVSRNLHTSGSRSDVARLRADRPFTAFTSNGDASPRINSTRRPSRFPLDTKEKISAEAGRSLGVRMAMRWASSGPQLQVSSTMRSRNQRGK